LAQELRLSEETMRLIRIGGMLHDVGKIGVPAEILRKPGHLTEEEYEAIKQHPSLGAMIVGAVPGMEGIVDAVRYHHERWDGKGYPDKLAGTDIPMIGRIIAKGAGTQFDPLMARAFCNVIRWRLTVESKSGDLDEIAFDDEMPLAA
jgi:response regulator RpfG family c-di-GMP phosphodiesterase